MDRLVFFLAKEEKGEVLTTEGVQDISYAVVCLNVSNVRKKHWLNKIEIKLYQTKVSGI